MSIRKRAALAVALLALAGGAVEAQQASRFADEPRGLVGPLPYPEEVQAAPLPPEIVDDKKRKRNYPDQPPLIPHSIRDYQIDRNSNKCLTCHSRQFTEQSQAPMISVTHYMDRAGNMLAAVSPRRYFCTSCHVTQASTEPLVENRFIDVDQMLKRTAPPGEHPR